MKQKHIITLSLGLSLGFSLLAGAAMAKITNPSPHRKVDAKGIGNCVFSTSELGFKQDSSYQLKNSFSAPENAHIRCYFPKALSEYKSLGKVMNELNEKSQYWASLSVKGDGGYFVIDRMLFNVTNWDSDQQRFDITGDSESDFGFEVGRERDAKRFGALVKNPEAEYHSVHLANYTKAMAESAGKYPYTANFCVDVYVNMADETKTVEKVNQRTNLREWVKEPVVKQHLLSKSCFDYTLKSASDVSWSPGQSSSNESSSSASSEQQKIDEAAKDLLKGLGF